MYAASSDIRRTITFQVAMQFVALHEGAIHKQ
jgi:hypothetical protein